MDRDAVFRSLWFRAAVATAPCLALLGIVFPEASSARILLASSALGLSAAAGWKSISARTDHHVRELRRRIEELLRPIRGDRPFAPAADEIAALHASVELAGRQVHAILDALQRDGSRLEAILGSMVEGVVAVDPVMRVTFANRAFTEAMGSPAPAAPPRPGTPLVQVVRDHSFLEMFTAVLQSGAPSQKRIVFTGPGARSFEVQVTPLAGNHHGAIAMLYDITDIERLERIRKDFVANVSHELRTPLAAVCGYAETLLEGGLDDSKNRRKFAEIILGKARQLSNIVADLLALSSLESGKPPVLRPVSLKESIESALRTVEPLARSRNVRILCGSFDDQSVLGHDTRLEQVFVNLLDNAIKFNRPDGEVRVEVGGAPELAVVRVCDTGLGIPSRDLPRIFERFYRVDKARSRATGGTGLGLSIVKHAVEQMGGTVSVESHLGHGSVFTVSLPPDR